MYAAQVKEGHVKINGGFQVIQRLAEAQASLLVVKTRAKS